MEFDPMTFAKEEIINTKIYAIEEVGKDTVYGIRRLIELAGEEYTRNLVQATFIELTGKE